MSSTRYQSEVAIIRYQKVLITGSKCRISRQALIAQDVSLVEVLKLWLIYPKPGMSK